MSSTKHTFRVTGDARSAAGEAFRVAREELGLSQSDVGARFRKSQNAVYNWEKGKTAPPIEPVRWLGARVSPETRKALFIAYGITSTEELLSVTPETRTIPLLRNLNDVEENDAVVVQSLVLPADWLPSDANIRAARFSQRISPLFGDEVVALVDIRYRDPDRLKNCVVVARTPRGNEAMRLTNDEGTYLLVPISEQGDQRPRVLRPEGDWSIVGKIIKWIGDAPAPARK